MDKMKGSLKSLISGFAPVNNYLIQNYKKLGLTDQEFMIYLNLLSYANQNNLFPDMKVLSDNLEISESEVFNLISNLEQKNILSIETRNIDGRASSYYDLNLIYQLDVEEQRTESKNETDSEQFNFNQLIQKFEVESGRPLSPIEIEKISGWLMVDHFRSELIEMALREAVLAQVYNFKYIDRILMNWKQKNIRTVQDYERSRINNDLL